MKKSPSHFSIILSFTCLMLVGLALIPLLSVKLSPSQAMPQINVWFSLPGNAARVVEMEATSKLEAMLGRIKGVESIWSTSGNGWGSVNVRLNKYTDIDIARFEASTIIRQTWPSLPQGTSYPSISINRSDNESNGPFLSYTVNAPVNPVVIKQFAENQIKTKLSGIEGINKIEVSGAMPMEWRLTYDDTQLIQTGISAYDIQTAINQYLKRDFWGTVSIEDTEGKKQWIRIAVQPKTEKNQSPDLSKIAVKNINGKIIALNEIANLSHLEQQAQRYYRINGLNSIYLSITADENANQLELSKKIRNELELMKSIFPSGYEIHTGYDATEYIRDEMEKIYFRTGLTLLILLLFILITYRSFKYLLLVIFTLLANISIAVIFYYFLKLEMQLYSLAGITISLTLVIDNTIIMSDQILRRKNMNAFLPVFTATATTIASLVIIFFLDEEIRLNLQDFAYVIIINLTVSLFIALFLVPALMSKLKMGKRKEKKYTHKYLKYRNFILFRHIPSPKRFNIYFMRFYGRFCQLVWKFRVLAIILIIISFGLPVFLLPDKIEKDNQWATWYNDSFGSNTYKEKIKPHVDVILGGTLRLFIQKVYEGSYFTNREETSLHVTATLPNGATIEQMNHLIQRMESYIRQFQEVKQFQTSIDNARRASINIRFTKENQKNSFPYYLKSNLISQSLQLGGGSWGVYGLGDGFNNDVRENAGSYRVKMYGFNYDELYEQAENFKAKLMNHRRIKEVSINSDFSWYKDDYKEFTFKTNKEKLAENNILPTDLFASLSQTFGQNIYAGEIPGEYGMERIVLQSQQSKTYDIWKLQEIPVSNKEKSYKISSLAEIEKTDAPQNITKENQQYRLCLQYEYIGSYEQGKKILERSISEFKEILPLGYSIENDERQWGWNKDNNKQYLLLLLIFVIIYFTCCILFNSFKQPFYVIFVIPISFIGIFLTFYLFKLNFDQGGFASFILLCGTAVNANIYILNEYNHIRNNRKLSPLKAYVKAWTNKISPIFLTVISTILGFIPFLVGEYKEAFWYPLAAGTIGGMIISLLGTFCFLPLFMGVGRKRKK